MLDPEEPRTKRVAAACLCATLYCLGSILTAETGLLMGFFVQFRPAVVIPIVFAVLFGPFVGGLGAAIGTFVASVYFYGHPFLTIFSGTPANFLGFWVVGYAARRLRKSGPWILVYTTAGLVAIAALIFTQSLAIEVKALSLFLIVFITCTTWGLYYKYLEYRWANALILGSIVGMAIGSLIIAAGLWLMASILIPFGAIILPSNQAGGVGGFAVPTYAVLSSFLMVFLPLPIALIVAIPVIEACWRVFPSLRAEFFRRK